MTVADDKPPRQFHHGTRADLKPGDLIAPGYSSNYGQREQASWVYLTGTLDAAVWGAELAAGERPGRIYVVEAGENVRIARRITRSARSTPPRSSG